MIECKMNILLLDIEKMVVYKIFNGINEMIVVYFNGNINSSLDFIVIFLDGVLILMFLSLKCNDEGLYICVVIIGNLEVFLFFFLIL